MSAQSEITRLSSKGQIVLPSRIRSARRWPTGTEFLVQETPEGILLTPVVRTEATRIEDVAGCLKPHRNRRVSLVDMEAAIARETSKRHARGRY